MSHNLNIFDPIRCFCVCFATFIWVPFASRHLKLLNYLIVVHVGDLQISKLFLVVFAAASRIDKSIWCWKHELQSGAMGHSRLVSVLGRVDRVVNDFGTQSWNIYVCISLLSLLHIYKNFLLFKSNRFQHNKMNFNHHSYLNFHHLISMIIY